MDGLKKIINETLVRARGIREGRYSGRGYTVCCIRCKERIVKENAKRIIYETEANKKKRVQYRYYCPSCWVKFTPYKVAKCEC